MPRSKANMDAPIRGSLRWERISLTVVGWLFGLTFLEDREEGGDVREGVGEGAGDLVIGARRRLARLEAEVVRCRIEL